MTTLILGAPDPEMSEIERVSLAAGCRVLYAAVDGRRVHPGVAYRADGVASNGLYPRRVDLVSVTGRVVTVECAVTGIDQDVAADHHRPGDPGYGRPPAEYWEASSLGQVCTLLRVAPTPKRRIVAAADHCLRAAYAGLCPGVSPRALSAWRVQSRAIHQGISASTLATRIVLAKSALRRAPVVNIGGHEVRDMRGVHVPELPEAACHLGVSYVAGPIDMRSGRKKYIVSGTADVVRSWMRECGLQDVYGDPVRGFAGGYANRE